MSFIHVFKMLEWKEYFDRIYFDPEQPLAFAGRYKLYQILQQIGQPTSYTNVKKWLQKQDAFTSLKPLKYRFKRKTIITKGIDDLWDADLADVSNLSSHKNEVKFLLIVIDVFSIYLWVEPLLIKSHTHVLQSIQNIFKRTQRRPTLLRTDNGKDFTNRWVKQFLKKQDIYAYTTKMKPKPFMLSA